MPQWRKLHTKVTESLDFNEMPDDFTRLLWALLPLGLDREGRSLDNASLVKARLMPLRDDVSSAQVVAALDWYASRGMIVRYHADGHRYFYVPTFSHYQGNTSREAESTYPAPPVADCVSNSRPTHDQLMSESSTDVDVDVEEKREEKSADAAPDGASRTFPEWQQALKDADHRGRPDLVRQFMQAYLPNNELPAHSYISKTAKDVGGWGRLLDLLWQQVPRPPTGDVLAFVLRVHEHRGNGRESPRADPVPLERKVADIPKGWLQEPFDPDEEPQL